MASVFLRTTGEIEVISPGNGRHWTLEEMQTLVGGYIEIVRTSDGKFMVIDEEGKLAHKMKPVNAAASMLYRGFPLDVIAGDVLVVDTKLELEGPEDDEC